MIGGIIGAAGWRPAAAGKRRGLEAEPGYMYTGGGDFSDSRFALSQRRTQWLYTS